MRSMLTKVPPEVRRQNWERLRPMDADLVTRLVAASELHGEFVLSSGRRSSVYFDKFRFLTRPDLLRELAAAVT